MDFTPMFKSRSVDRETNLHIGVEVIYEEEDAEALVHILNFFVDEHERSKGKLLLVPSIFVNGNKTNVRALLKSLNEFPQGKRDINGTVALYFLDEMRSLFEAYLASLEKFKKDSEKAFEWSSDHLFYDLLEDYRTIARIFFPPREGME